MAKERRKKSSTGRRTASKKASSRPLWKGSINFGLVNIPVALYPAQVTRDLDFDLLDRQDFSRIRYRRVNEKTGKEVPWNRIVKGFQYNKGEYVALSDEDFAKADVEATQSIDIVHFVNGSAISPIYYDKPYFIEPLKSGQRSYALLREVMKRQGKIGIAKVVIRTRQHLAALLVDDAVLILNLLRFAHELRNPSGLEVPDSKRGRFSSQELKMAEHLVGLMESEWQPEQYRDEYRAEVLELIEQKIKSGQTKTPAASKPQRQGKGNVVDIMSLLKRSVDEARQKETPAGRRKAS